MKTVLIVYAGATPDGSTATLAGWIKTGAESVSGITASVKEASTVTLQDVTSADGILCGSGDYNGNPEPAMINFLDNVLKVGSGSKLQTMPFGVFATSAGYSTGVQEVLQSMARALLTFGAIYVGGGNWHVGQGIAGMTKKTDSGWEWADATGLQKYLKEDTCEYGRRLALATIAIPDNLIAAQNANPSKCSNPKPKPGPTPGPKPKPKPTPSKPLTTQEKVNLALAVIFVVALLVCVILWKDVGLLKPGLIVASLLLGVAIITGYVSRNESTEDQRRDVTIAVMAVIICALVAAAVYWNTKGVNPKIAETVLGPALAAIIVLAIVLILSVQEKSPGPGPGPGPPGKKYTIPKPTDLSSKDQTEMEAYLQTLYPMFESTKPSTNLWKTLDFFYEAQQLSSGQFSKAADAAIGWPQIGGGMATIVKTALNDFRKGIPDDKRMLDSSFLQRYTSSYAAQYLDVVTYPFTGPEDSVSVDGLFINRFAPDDLFGKNIGFCRTGTHQAEFAVVNGATGTSACYLGTRGSNGEILGFKDNQPIEFVHKFTHNSSVSLGTQFFDTMKAGFGDYLYYARGSGVFFNPGKVLNARNKVDAMRIALNHSVMTPTVSGWNDKAGTPQGDKSQAKNPFYGKCDNSLEGFRNLVKTWGTDKEIQLIGSGENLTMASSNYPDFLSSSDKLSCTENGYSYGDNTGFWCPGVPIAMQHHCCVGAGDEGKCAQGASSGSYISGTDSVCKLTMSPHSDVSWQAFKKLVPNSLPDGTKLSSDEDQLTWLLYVCCNGPDSKSGGFANPWSPGDKLSSKQTQLLTKMVAWMANVGGIGDDAYIVPMKYTALDSSGNRIFDTCIMSGQPEATGTIAIEIMTLIYDNSTKPFSTVQPETGDIGTCELVKNPGFTGSYGLTGKSCEGDKSAGDKGGYGDCKDGSVQGICVANGQGKAVCQPPSVLTCKKKVSWATPILSYPIWPEGQKAPMDITGDSPTPPPSGTCKTPSHEDCCPTSDPDCTLTRMRGGSCTDRGCCWKPDGQWSGPWCSCPEGTSFDPETKTCK